jgi:hypothetical protein
MLRRISVSLRMSQKQLSCDTPGAAPTSTVYIGESPDSVDAQAALELSLLFLPPCTFHLNASGRSHIGTGSLAAETCEQVRAAGNAQSRGQRLYREYAQLRAFQCELLLNLI